MKKLNVGGINKKDTTPAAKYPTIVVDDEAGQLLEQYLVIFPEFKSAEGKKKALSGLISEKIKSAYFNHFNGRAVNGTGTLLVQVKDKFLKLITKNAYSKTVQEEAPLAAAIGQKMVDKYFHQATLVNVDMDLIPDDKQQEFIDKLKSIAGDLGVESALEYKQYITPNIGFHENRTALLTPAQNIALDKVMPTVAYPKM